MAEEIDETECASILKVLAEPFRLKILKCLQAGPMTVTDVATLLEIEIANASHHLRALKNARLANSHREGKHIYYALNKDYLAKAKLSSVTRLEFGCCRFEFKNDERSC